MAKTRQLVQGLGRLEATSLVVGGIIGSTIFLVTSDVAQIVGSPFLVLVTWLVAGLLSGTAAICFAELSASMPQTGGIYVFLKRAYRSDILAFGYAWMMCFTFSTGAIAVVAILAATFLMPVLLDLKIVSQDHTKMLAVSMIAILTFLNVRGVRQGGMAQNILTALKLILMLAVIVIPLLMADLQPASTLVRAPVAGDWADAAQNVGRAMILCLFSYSGAYFITHVAAEVKEPQKNIPRAIIFGFLTVILLYLALNVTYLMVLPFDEVRSSTHIARDVMDKVLGPAGAMIISLAICFSAIGVLNAQLLNYPRIILAAANDGHFFKKLGEVNERTRVPVNAIVMVGILASGYAVSGSYSEILTVVAFIAYLFICLAIIALIIMRVREPDLPRPYKAWGYPFTPIVFIGLSALYLGNLLVTETVGALIGTATVLAGLPFYWYWKKASLRAIAADQPE